MPEHHGDGAMKEHAAHQHADSPTPFHHQLHDTHHSHLLKHAHSQAHKHTECSLPTVTIVDEQPNKNAINGDSSTKQHGQPKDANPQGDSVFSTFEALNNDTPTRSPKTNREAIKPASGNSAYSDFEKLDTNSSNQNAMTNREAIKPQSTSVFSTFEALDLDLPNQTSKTNAEAIKPRK